MKNNIIKKLLLLSVVILTASSCVIKKYNSPQFTGEVDSLYRVLEMKVDTTVNTGQIHWSEFFLDTTLRRYISRVLEFNHDIQSARKNIEIAYAQLRSARAAIAPSVGAATFGTNAMFPSGGTSIADNFALSATASWELDIWGKMLSAKRSAQAALMASQEGVQALQTTLVSQTASAYYQLVTLDMERAITIETIENRAQYLDTMRIMKQSGKVNEVAVQQAVAQLSEVEAALPKIELAIIKTENALSNLMGTTSLSTLARRNTIDLEDTHIMPDIGVPAQLISFRPDVRAAEQQYRNAFELYNVSRAAMYPSLSISANGNVADIFNVHLGTLNLLAGLTQPIFNGRKLRSQKEIADLTAQQYQLAFQKAVLNAGKEVSDALASQMKTQQQGRAQKKQLDAYSKAYQYSFELFVNGYATYLDVLTAQTGVFNTQISLLETYFANVQARIELYRALGGGAETQLSQSEVIERSKTQSKMYKEELKAEKRAAKAAEKK